MPKITASRQAAADSPATSRARRGRRGRGVDIRPGSIREARLQADLTMAELAGDELTRGAIYLFETGRARPSEEVLNLIAARTDKPLVFFRSPQPAAVSAQSLARLAGLVAAGRAAQALELGGRLLGSATEANLEARIRLHMANAALQLGRLEAALLGARQAHRLASGDGDRLLAAEARLVEVLALQRSGDPAALQRAGEALADVRRQRPAPPGLEVRLLRVIGAIHEQQGDWAAAAAAYEAVIQQRPGTPAIGRAIDALEAEARRLSGRNADAETATQWQAVALRWVQEQAALAVDSAIGLGRARARLGAPDEARRVLDGAADLARVEGLDAQRCRVVLELAELALRESRPDEAHGHVAEALALAAAAGDHRTLGVAHLLAGMLAARDGDQERAGAEMRQALADLESAGDADRLLEAHWAYAELLEAQGRINEALQQWKLATGLARPDLQSRATPRPAPATPAPPERA